MQNENLHSRQTIDFIGFVKSKIITKGGLIIKVNRVEKHRIKNKSPAWEIIDKLSFKSKNLYNYANYYVRQEFINNKKYIGYYDLKKILKTHEPYKEFGSQTAQQTLVVLNQNWQSFFAAIKDWRKNPSKYLGRPKLPKYKNKEKGRFPVIITNIQFAILDEYIRFSWKPLQSLNNMFKTNIKDKLMQIRFIPKGADYILEIVYEINIPEINQHNQRITGIDIGVNNLATVSNNIGVMPFIINGKPLKSINQYYNKKKAQIQSDLKKNHNKNWSKRLEKLTAKRTNKIIDYMHKTSKYIVNWCNKNNIDLLVVGYNKKWKQSSKLSERVNQNFVQIPYQMFINQLKYKCQNIGIEFVISEESYTSGTSFLDNEQPIKEYYNKDRRKYRGLFISNKNIKINADLNGAYQIIKKVAPNVFNNGVEDVCLHPIRVNII